MSTTKRFAPPLVLFASCVALRVALERGAVPGGSAGGGALARAVEVATWLTGAWLVNALIEALFWRRVVESLAGAPVPRLLVQFSNIVVYLLAIVGIVGVVFDKSVTTLLAASGAVGIVLGFALRSLILDAFSGIALHLDRPFAIGDFVSIVARGVKIEGKVADMNWRATWVLTSEGHISSIPNSEVGSAAITNLSRPTPVNHTKVGLTFDFAVAPERVLRVITAGLAAAVGEGAALADPAPAARIAGVDEHGVVYDVGFSVDGLQTSVSKARHVVLLRVLDHLFKAAIAPALPKVEGYYARLARRSLDYAAPDHRVEVLGRVEIFSTLEREDVALVASRLSVRRITAHETVVRQGDAGESLFVVVEGLLDVLVARESRVDSLQVGQMAPGSCFGEISLLTGEVRSATVVAATDAVVFEITKDHLTALLDARPEVATMLCDVAAARRVRESLRFAEAASSAPDAEVARKGLAAQMFGRMREFFGRVFTP
jgi:small-conductance mechanosensitive channel/CRP-like cAMP-binding protein